MSLILSTPKSGRALHIYEDKGDNISLCGRAVLNRYAIDFDVEAITCDKCRRAYDILVRNSIPKPDPVTIAIKDLHKKKVKAGKSTKQKAPRSSSSPASPKKSGKKSKPAARRRPAKAAATRATR